MGENYFQISEERLGEGAKIPILKLGDSGEVFYEIALEMADEIEKNNQAGKFYLPGGTGGPVADFCPPGQSARDFSEGLLVYQYG